MNVGRSSMGGRKAKRESGGELWRRFQGALDKGFGRSAAYAIASSEQVKLAQAARRLREAMFPHLRQPRR